MMIALPALGAIVAGVASLVEAAIVAAGIGAAVGGAACGIGGAVSGIQEQGVLNREVADRVVHRAGECAVEGAVIGGATGAVGLAVAPVVAPALGSALTAVDDVARPAVHAVDDLIRPAAQALDDAIGPAIRRARHAFGVPVRLLRSLQNARNYRTLARGQGEKGYFYVMKDINSGGKYKFGKTIQPKERLKQVQANLNKSSVGGKVEYTCIISTDRKSSLEKSMKNRYEAQNIKNYPAGTEWFILSAAQVAAACSH